MGKMIAYYRVSTDKQGKSKLGLEGQELAINSYSKAHHKTIVRTYTEVETAKGDGGNRPELMKAISHAKRSRATLVIAKLDRLSRNVHFLSGLMESGVDFVACDNPNANRLTLHILVAVAEDEAKRISERTKAALAAYKAGGRVSERIRELYPGGVPAAIVAERGGKLGAHLPEARPLSPEARRKGARVSAGRRVAAAAAAYEDLAPLVADLKAEGRTLRQIAAALNGEGHTTRSGRPWNHVQVKRVLDRSGGDRKGASGEGDEAA